MSEILVGAAEGTGKALGMSEVFIGIVFLAVDRRRRRERLGHRHGAQEQAGPDRSASPWAAASRSRCSSRRSWCSPAGFIAPQPLELSFSRAEIGTLFLGVLIGAIVAGDGRSNWYKGVQLTLVYAMIAIMFYFLPQSPRSFHRRSHSLRRFRAGGQRSDMRDHRARAEPWHLGFPMSFGIAGIALAEIESSNH